MPPVWPRDRYFRRAISTDPQARRRGHGAGVARRANRAGAAAGGLEAHQGGHVRRDRRCIAFRRNGNRSRSWIIRRSPRYSTPASRRKVSRTSSWSMCRGCRSRVLRPAQAHHPRAPRTVHPGLRRRAARAPEGDHPSRSEAGQHFGGRGGRQTGAADHRFRPRQSGDCAANGPDALYAVWTIHGYPRLHEPGAGESEHTRYRHTHRCVFPRCDSLRIADRHAAVPSQGAAAAFARGMAAPTARRGAAPSEQQTWCGSGGH